MKIFVSSPRYYGAGSVAMFTSIVNCSLYTGGFIKSLNIDPNIH